MSIPINNTASGSIGGGSLNKEKLKVLKIFTQTNPQAQTQMVEYLDKLEGKKNSICEEINEIDVLMKAVITQSYS